MTNPRQTRAARRRDAAETPAPRPTAAPPADAPSGWGALMPDAQWRLFLAGVDALDAAGVPFLLHGALALATYTGRWRNTKDVDVVVRAADRERAVAALRGAGFADYFEREAYDRSWIFRGYRDEVIFDIIWALPNHRVEIDGPWFERAQPLTIRGRNFTSVPAEELIRVKLYVFQRGRCDWVDVLNVLAAVAGRLDWRWLVERMGSDLPLLQAAVTIFNWLAPQRAQAMPEWVRARFALAAITSDDLPALEARHVRLLDSRPWFALHQPADRVLEL